MHFFIATKLAKIAQNLSKITKYGNCANIIINAESARMNKG